MVAAIRAEVLGIEVERYYPEVGERGAQGWRVEVGGTRRGAKVDAGRYEGSLAL